MCVTSSGLCKANRSAEAEEDVYDVPASYRQTAECHGETGLLVEERSEKSEYLLLFADVLSVSHPRRECL